MKCDAVYDCMIFLQSLINGEGPAAECFRRMERDEVVLYWSEAILDEVRDAASRPKLRRRYPRITDVKVEDLLSFVRKHGETVETVPELFEYARDPKDEKYLNLAIAAQASLVVSRDKDLLDLMTSDDTASIVFRERFPDITVLNPVAFLQYLDGDNL